VPDSIAVASITTLTEALDLCWKGSGVCAKDMAARLGIDYCAFVRMFNPSDPRHFPPDLIPALMRESKSRLPLEWLAMQMNMAVHDKEIIAILGAIRSALSDPGKEVRFCFNRGGGVELL
jgi:hypothetical protein